VVQVQTDVGASVLVENGSGDGVDIVITVRLKDRTSGLYQRGVSGAMVT
jgi:hypothetical protein